MATTTTTTTAAATAVPHHPTTSNQPYTHSMHNDKMVIMNIRMAYARKSECDRVCSRVRAHLLPSYSNAIIFRVLVHCHAHLRFSLCTMYNTDTSIENRHHKYMRASLFVFQNNLSFLILSAGIHGLSITKCIVLLSWHCHNARALDIAMMYCSNLENKEKIGNR